MNKFKVNGIIFATDEDDVGPFRRPGAETTRVFTLLHLNTSGYADKQLELVGRMIDESLKNITDNDVMLVHLPDITEGDNPTSAGMGYIPLVLITSPIKLGGLDSDELEKGLIVLFKHLDNYPLPSDSLGYL
jgi:hypothetical protein